MNLGGAQALISIDANKDVWRVSAAGDLKLPSIRVTGDHRQQRTVMAEGDVNCAGMDALGIPGVLYRARTDLFNQTPFAIETNPTAEAKVTQNNLITTAAGSSIKSVGHISLLTTRAQ